MEVEGESVASSGESRELSAKLKNGTSDTVDGQNENPKDDEIIILDETDDDGNSTGKLSLYGMAGKKTAAQGLMDLALITSNANQLRYVLEYNRRSHTFHVTVTLIILSLALQVTVAMFLIFRGRYYVTGRSKSENARRVKRCVLLGVFLVTVVNVFIASFTTLENSGRNV